MDLDKAPHDGEGRVRFWADFVLLQPADPARGNRRLLSYVVNRGQRVGVPFNRYAPRLPHAPAIPSDSISITASKSLGESERYGNATYTMPSLVAGGSSGVNCNRCSRWVMTGYRALVV